MNVVPSELTAYFDVRVTPLTDMDEMEEQLLRWCQESGEGVKLDFLVHLRDATLTSTQPGNIWWDAFSSACQSV